MGFSDREKHYYLFTFKKNCSVREFSDYITKLFHVLVQNNFIDTLDLANNILAKYIS